DVSLVGAARGARMPRARVREARDERGRLARTDLGGGLAEVPPRRRLDPVTARPELHDVQVQLQDPSPGERPLELAGKDHLPRLAERGPRRRQPQVPRELLREGGRAARQRPSLEGALECVLDLVQIDAPVAEEVDVLGDHHGALQGQRDGGVRHPGPQDAVVTPGRTLRRPIALDERRRSRRARREGTDGGPCPDLVAEPGARRQEPEEREPGPASSAAGRAGRARHGAKSSSCTDQVERSPWRGGDAHARPIADGLARSLHRVARDSRRAQPLAPADRAAARQPARSSPTSSPQLGGAEAPRVRDGGRRRRTHAPPARRDPLVMARWPPGARVADAAGHRKPLVTWTVGGFARIALLALALVPWMTSAPRAAIWLIIALNGVRSFMSNFGNPAWTVLVGDLVPQRLRARYFGNRNLMIMLAALLVAPLAGWLIKAGNGWLGQPYLGYQALFALAFVTGLAGTVCFLQIPGPHRAPRARVLTEGGTGLWAALVDNRAFLGLVVSGFVWNLALQVAAPFFNVYLVRHLGAGAGTVGVLAGVNTLFGLIGSGL